MRQEALDWLEEAQVSLRRAQLGLEQKDYAMSCFYAHQAVEMAMKAIILGLKRRRPPRTHDLTELYQEVVDLGLSVEEGTMPELSQYYVTSRYPNAGLHRPSISFSLLQAQRAMDVAQEVVEDARRLLAP